jgi:hypothetical protein
MAGLGGLTSLVLDCGLRIADCELGEQRRRHIEGRVQEVESRRDFPRIARRFNAGTSRRDITKLARRFNAGGPNSVLRKSRRDFPKIARRFNAGEDAQ